MGRLFFIVLVNLGAYFVLRQLWPSIREGWRRLAILGLSGLSVLSFALPLALGLGHHGVLPVVGTPLKLFGSGWLITAGLVMLLGWPLALLRGRSGRARESLVPVLQMGQEGASLVAAPAAGVDLQRRSLLTGVGRTLPLLAAGTSSVGLVAGSSGFEIREVEVRLRGLPRALDGFRIGQITDVHVGTFIDVEYVPFAVERGASLTLAGHTHGGQVAILGMPLFRFAFDYMLGRYRRGDGQLYVSGGTGHWLPFRLGVPAEVSILTLRADT